MTVVFLHAWPFDGRMWDAQRAVFPDAQAPTLYGPRSVREMAERVLAQAPERFVAVGASMGGYVALELARLDAGRLAGLVLAGSRADADPPERRAARQESIETARTRGVEGVWELMRPRLFADDADPAVVERAREIAFEQDPELLARATEAIRDRDDNVATLATLPVPALVILGENDPFVEGATYDGRDVRVEHVAGARHLPSLEQRERFDELLAEFLARV